MDLTDEQIAEYIKKGGVRCPNCTSDNLNGGSIEIDGGCAYQGVCCLDCAAEWVDEYKLVGVLPKQ